MDTENIYLSVLSRLPRVKISQLLAWKNLGITFEEIAKNQKKLSPELRLNTKAEEKLKEILATLDLQKVLLLCEKENIQAVNIFDENYPKLLAEIYDPSPVLFYKGTLCLEEEEICVAVVGTRKNSLYGQKVVENFCDTFSENKICVVSGLAYGIDSITHRSAVKSVGKTIAVLGSGVDAESLYPKMNSKLAEEIVESGGCVMSEYLPGTKPEKYFFVARNRIISGLSKASVIIECAEKSGALITADFAIEQNRLLYAVPGEINNPLSAGPNLLIQQGASLVTNAEEILKDLGIKSPTPESSSSKNFKVLPETTSLGANQLAMLQYLQKQPNKSFAFDELVQDLDFPSTEIGLILSQLELLSFIEKGATGSYYLKD